MKRQPVTPKRKADIREVESRLAHEARIERLKALGAELEDALRYPAPRDLRRKNRCAHKPFVDGCRGDE